MQPRALQSECAIWSGGRGYSRGGSSSINGMNAPSSGLSFAPAGGSSMAESSCAADTLDSVEMESSESALPGEAERTTATGTVLLAEQRGHLIERPAERDRAFNLCPQEQFQRRRPLSSSEEGIRNDAWQLGHLTLEPADSFSNSIERPQMQIIRIAIMLSPFMHNRYLNYRRE